MTRLKLNKEKHLISLPKGLKKDVVIHFIKKGDLSISKGFSKYIEELIKKDMENWEKDK